jgi:D-alanyl-D-alanine carboxypeptidase
MRHRPATWSLGPIAALLATVFALAGCATTPAGQGSAYRKLILEADPHFSGTVLVARGGHIAFLATLGPAGAARAGDRVWPWPSMSKAFTAIALLREAELGRVDLDKPLGAQVQGLDDPAAAAVTPERLMSHVARLPNGDAQYMAQKGYLAGLGAPLADVGDSTAWRRYCAGGAPEPSSGRYEYNNCDYQLANDALERLARTPYVALVSREVTGRAGVSVSWRAVPPGPSQAGGADFDLARRDPAYGARTTAFGTASDLWRFDEALLGHRLLSPAHEARVLRTPSRLGQEAYGFGQYDTGLDGCKGDVRVVERRGAGYGLTLLNLMVPDSDTVVVAISDEKGVSFGDVWDDESLAHRLLSRVACAAR